MPFCAARRNTDDASLPASVQHDTGEAHVRGIEAGEGHCRGKVERKERGKVRRVLLAQDVLWRRREESEK